MKKYLPGRDSNQGPFRQQANALPTELQKPSYIGRWKILIYCRRPRTSIGRHLFCTGHVHRNIDFYKNEYPIGWVISSVKDTSQEINRNNLGQHLVPHFLRNESMPALAEV